MKKGLLILLLICQFCVNAESYQYLGKDIKPALFEKMFKYFSQYLFTDGKTCYDLRDFEKDYEIPKLFSGNKGKFNGTISQVLGASRAIVSFQETYYFRRSIGGGRMGISIGPTKVIMEPRERKTKVNLINFPTAGMIDNQSCSGYAIEAGTYSFTTVLGARSTIKQYKNLIAITKEDFKKHIAKVKEPLIFIKKSIKKVKCKPCKGKGYVRGKAEKGKMSGEKIECEDCKGKKYIEDITYIKKPLK